MYPPATYEAPNSIDSSVACTHVSYFLTLSKRNKRCCSQATSYWSSENRLLFYICICQNTTLNQVSGSKIPTCQMNWSITYTDQEWNQNQSRLNPTRRFPRLAPATISDWFIGLSASSVIGQSNCFDFGFTTQLKTALCVWRSLEFTDK